MYLPSDLRFGARMLIKTPLLSLVAILTIALGIGLTTHTFSSVYGSVLRGVPVPGADRLVFIGENRPELGISQMSMSIHDFLDLREQQTSFGDVAAFYQGTANLAGEDAPPERFAGAYVSYNALSHLGIPPLMGRTFRAGEDAPDAAPALVLGHHVWQNRFGGDPSILGRSLRVNGELAEVIGVMPEGFRFPFLEDVWLPHRIDAAGLPRGGGMDLDVFGRLKEGTSLEVARAELSAIASRISAEFPETNEGVGMMAEPYEDRYMPREIQAILWVMLVATFGVLLIACANVANLLLARVSVRSKEIAVRASLGAGRWKVVRQLMVEASVLAVLGGILGLGIAALGLRPLRAAIADIYKPYWIDFRMDAEVVIFSVLATAGACLAAGVLPALRASGVKIGEILKDESRGSTGLRMGRLSNLLVISELTVSCALLVGAGFMIRSVVNLRNLELGFQPSGVMTGRIGLFETDYPDPESRDQFFFRLKERLASEPGVVSAALGTSLPGLGSSRYFISVEGESYPTDRDHPLVSVATVSTDYFETFGVQLVQGRDFDPMEARLGGDPVVIVNESFAERYLPGTSALDERIRLGPPESTRPWRRVVGVVPDMHVGGNVGGIGDDQLRPERIFLPQGALDVSFMSLAVKTQGPPASMATALRDIVAQLDPNLPVYDLFPLDQAIKESTWAFGLFGSLFSIFGAAALFLAAVGLYGVMAFSVSLRKPEMGVRMALGADSRAVERLVLGLGARQLLIGMGVGLALGVVMSQSMRVILYGVQIGDPLVYLSIVLTLTATGFVASYLPARAATRTDPVEAIRGL